MPTPEADQRSASRKAKDEQIAAEPQLTAPQLPSDAAFAPVEAHLVNTRQFLVDARHGSSGWRRSAMRSIMRQKPDLLSVLERRHENILSRLPPAPNRRIRPCRVRGRRSCA